METDKRTYTIRLKLADVEYTVEALPETLEIRGNAQASGDDAEDRRVEDSIIADLESGNEWAWCCVRVTAQVGSFKGPDHLGGCSYKSKADFCEPGGYFDDMKNEALARLVCEIEAAGGVLEP